MKNVGEFLSNIHANSKPTEELSVCLKALWWVKKGNWEKAHDLAQDEGSSKGDWIHAYLHRVEGDLGNAAYWYNRASKPVKRDENLEKEWEELVEFFLTQSDVVNG